MVQKKSSKADLENKKSLFFEIGLAVAMLLVLMAFEWETTREIDLAKLVGNNSPVNIDLPPITTDPDKLIKPLPPRMISYVDKIVVIDNNLTPRESSSDIFINPDFDGIPPILKPAEETEVEDPVIVVEEMPKFGEGGLDEFRNDFVFKKLIYPENAQSNGIYGCVYVEFVIEKDGSVSSVKALRGPDSSLNNEAIRVVKLSPRWTPGKHNGKPARVKFVIPINFILNE